MKKRRPIIGCECGDHFWSALTRGFVTLVSPEDCALLQKSWHSFVNKAGNVYAKRSSYPNGTAVYLHRNILAAGSKEVDHINRNGLDNRRGNLRAATKQQNAANRLSNKKYRGIFFSKRNLSKPWVVHIGNSYVGYFHTEHEAALAYDAAAVKLYGQFARLNLQQSSALGKGI